MKANMEGLLKIKVLVDEDLVGTTAYTRMEQALQRQHYVMMKATGDRLGAQYEVERHEYDVNEIPWRNSSYYSKTMYMPKFSWVQEMTDKYIGDADFMFMPILGVNWKPPLKIIGGFNAFLTQVLQVHLDWSVNSWFVTIEEELVHAFDQLAMKRLGVSFNKLFDVKSYDGGVVHGEDPRYTRSQYSKLYEIAADALIKMFPNDITMLDLVITPDNEQWVLANNGLAYKIYNVDTLNELKDAGVISSVTPRAVDTVSDSGRELIILTRE